LHSPGQRKLAAALVAAQLQVVVAAQLQVVVAALSQAVAVER
jgi:hypothetical protein